MNRQQFVPGAKSSLPNKELHFPHYESTLFIKQLNPFREAGPLNNQLLSFQNQWQRQRQLATVLILFRRQLLDALLLASQHI